MIYGLRHRTSGRQSQIRKRQGNFVTNPHPHSALRDLRQHMLRPVTLGVCLGVAGILGIAGPFGTDETLGGAQRFGYWAIVVLVTYGMGYGISAGIRTRWGARWSRAMVIGVTALASGAGVTAAVVTINGLALGFWPSGAGWVRLLGTVFPVAALIAVIFDIVADHIRPTNTAPAPETKTKSPPPLLDRVPLDKRGELVALSVEDHYVRIITTRGRAVVLMRLADAIRETGDTPGQQVHRSHWVALGAVTAARRTGDNAVLTLSTGDQIPVSRRYVATIKEAGLLPR